MDRFANLRDAGSRLALKLDSLRDNNDVVVLAILLGGGPVAHEVARHLHAPMDFVLIRRLFAPQETAYPICAVNVAGTMVIDENLIPPTTGPSTPVEHFVADAIAQMNIREQTCRAARPLLDLAGKTIVLVDCGIRTGSTMQATIAALRTREPEKVIAAVPVSSGEGMWAVEQMADEFVCLGYPAPFGHVGMWYRDFSRPDDDKVGESLGLLAKPG